MNKISLYLATAFLAGIALNLNAKELPIIHVNFVFATDNNKAKPYDNLAQGNKELDILNRYFVTEKNQPIFNFKLKQYIAYKDFAQMKCELSKELVKPKAVDRSSITQKFQQCFKPQPSAAEIYIFIFDGYSEKLGFKAVDSWGFNNSGRPLVLLDWQRLNYNVQAALPHEMGHAFGLRHVCIKGAKYNDSTNLMASKGGCDGSGGQRNQGFNQQQLDIIMQQYLKLR